MKRESIVRINDIIEQVTSYHPEADVAMLMKAYVFSAKVHQGQTRLSGEPYMEHPLCVAKLLAGLSLDEYTVSTGLLHDTVEDTYTTIQELKKMFGDEIAFLVDGVTKIGELTYQSKIKRQAETFRKMILAMSKDIRVVLVKLADRVHNMRTLEYLPPEKQHNIAQQTLEIYAPLAGRLGIFLIKKELEDLSLRYLQEKVYGEIEEKIVVTAEQREKYVQEVVGIIEEKLEQFRIAARITGRPKHIYSIYNKMIQQNLDFNQIYDLTAFRIIVDNRKECYEVLGIVHSIWKPIPGRFKDYISLPKANMYQALHTTVVGPYGQRIEIQIRTEEMDRVARHGIAAHWKYKEGRKIEQKDDQRFAWLRQIMESHNEVKDSREFLEAFRVDLFPNEVYVFTPAGEVIELPMGSTPIDYAYRIHTDVGHTCIGAKVNGKIAPLKYALKSGDVVEILTQSKQKPSRDWLKIAKTARAKTKIRYWIKQQERERSIALGREICEKEFRRHNLNFAKLAKSGEILDEFTKENIKSLDDLIVSVGQGRISAKQVLNRFLPKELQEDKAVQKEVKLAEKKAAKKSADGIRIQGIDDLMVRFGKCCTPIPGDKVMGYITRGRGVTIHTAGCPFLESADPDRIIEAQWGESCTFNALVPIEVMFEDKKGLLAEITTSISTAETNIVNAKARTTPEHKAVGIFTVEISSLGQLDSVIQEVKKVSGVLAVRRIGAPS